MGFQHTRFHPFKRQRVAADNNVLAIIGMTAAQQERRPHGKHLDPGKRQNQPWPMQRKRKPETERQCDQAGKNQGQWVAGWLFGNGWKLVAGSPGRLGQR